MFFSPSTSLPLLYYLHSLIVNRTDRKDALHVSVRAVPEGVVDLLNCCLCLFFCELIAMCSDDESWRTRITDRIDMTKPIPLEGNADVSMGLFSVSLCFLTPVVADSLSLV